LYFEELSHDAWFFLEGGWGEGSLGPFSFLVVKIPYQKLFIIYVPGWKLIWIWESLRRLENTSNGDDMRGIFTSCAVLVLDFFTEG